MSKETKSSSKNTLENKTKVKKQPEEKENKKQQTKKATKPTFSKKIGFVSLGCDKNRVDTENIITLLSQYSNFSYVSSPVDADIIIINTCAFLSSARQEAEETIQEMGELKNKNLQKLIVVGCLPLLEHENILQKFPCVDKVIVPQDYNNIVKIIFDLFGQKFKALNSPLQTRWLTTPMHYAYLKIADGCNNRCAFCKIPFIRGNYTSRPMEELVQEAELLCERGVKEIILVAQDITRYGMDLYKGYKLTELLQKLSKIKKLSWIRLLYCYPDMISDELINEIKNNHKVVKYIDIPLQHIADNVLSNMKRHSSSQQIKELITKLKNEIPNIKIRSTFMVGFPNETKRDFKELTKFLKEYKLDNVGFFKYSREEGTSSYELDLQIEEKVKDKRLKEVQKIQENIANINNKKYIGEVFKVIIDNYDSENKLFVGRPYFSAPDIDFEILFSSFSHLTKVGAFADVEILDYKDGYFIGEVYYNEDNA